MNQAWFRDKCRINFNVKIGLIFPLAIFLKILEHDSYWFSIVITRNVIEKRPARPARAYMKTLVYLVPNILVGTKLSTYLVAIYL
jgi:hypothetical protein